MAVGVVVPIPNHMVKHRELNALCHRLCREQGEEQVGGHAVLDGHAVDAVLCLVPFDVLIVAVGSDDVHDLVHVPTCWRNIVTAEDSKEWP